ncbi:EsaB/YukD family protein [Streptomyces sp. NBC_01304]|uniref:EsaB/YukD family protein n=1 Tax=Streptomyces sp. NBC_01304 TaxID=2903818 RepID=UPI002E0F682F|nr:EsaB/YukD family protein [Streptomyces sp. NBC_01304]
MVSTAATSRAPRAPQTPQGPRSGLARVTLVGERRRADTVLPSDVPIGQLLPDLLELLGDQAAARPLTRRLTTADGVPLPPDSTLAAASLAPGAVLHLVRSDAAPAVEAGADLDLRSWRWRPAVRRIGAGAATVFFAAIAGLLARGAFGLEPVAYGLFGAALVAAAGGALASRLGANRGLATVLLLTCGVLAALGAWTLADAHALSGPARLALLAGALTLTLALLGLFSPLGRGGLTGAAAAAGLAAIWEAALALTDDAARTGAVLAVLSILLLGFLPRLALLGTGLTRIDDRRSAGTSVSSQGVRNALAATHRGLALATLLTTVSAAAAGWLLTAAEPSVWTVSLVALTVLVLCARSRAFPLVVEVLAVYAAAACLVVRLAALWLDHAGGAGPLALLSAAALLPLLALAAHPPEPVRARLGRWADLAESIGVVGLFPLAVGVFGAYGF